MNDRYVMYKKRKYSRRPHTSMTEAAIKQFILDYRKKFAMSPAVREIAAKFSMSTSTVSYYLANLEHDGWLLPRRPGLARNIIPAEKEQEKHE